MNHSVVFPQRSMMLSGTMRSGKTTASLLYVVGLSSYRHHGTPSIMVLFDPPYQNSIVESLLEFCADMSNIAMIPWSEELADDAMPSPENLHTVVCMVDSVFQKGNTVKTYSKPSQSILQYLKKLDDPKAIQPHILFSSHLPDAIEHPANRMQS